MKEQLTEINITKDDGELLASINFDEINVIAQDDVIVRMNYGKPKMFEDRDGKIYIEESDDD